MKGTKRNLGSPMLGSTLRTGIRMLQNCALGASWLPFAGWLQNSPKLFYVRFLAPRCELAAECFKTVFWNVHGYTLRGWPRMMQNCALGTSWLDVAGWLQKG